MNPLYKITMGQSQITVWTPKAHPPKDATRVEGWRADRVLTVSKFEEKEK